MKELIQFKNRKLRSHAYFGWRVLDALKNAARNSDVVLQEDEYFVGSSLLSDETKKKYYLKCFDRPWKWYKVTLTKDEAEYYKKLKSQRGGIGRR